ncbi:MAG: response regulator [Lachnospiraceae bacterium]|nr:response regulator [Lachnospiraceae bacterium]
MIYRLLIVDDEFFIRDELVTMLDYERYGIQCLAPACDGEEALSLVRKEQPDIVLTDVNMPFLNGVELVRRIKSEYPQTVVIMLSGYDDFSYVKESLLAGAMDYLKKPVSKMELVRVLTVAMDRINERIIADKDREIERKQVLSATSSLSDREYSDTITSDMSDMTGSSKAGSTLLFTPGSSAAGMTIPEGGFVLLLAEISGVDTLLETFQNDRSLLSYAIKQRITEEEEIGGKLLIFNNIFRTEEFILLLAADKGIREAAEALAVLLSEFTGKKVKIGVSRKHFSEYELRLSYEEGRRALRTGQSSDNNVCYSEENSGAKGTITDVVTYIDRHFSDELSLVFLSEHFHIESTYLSRLFKKETGENVMNYIAKKRIGRAESLIREGELPINEIAFLVGYNDYNYFNKVFKKLTGLSPRDYREQVSKKSK